MTVSKAISTINKNGCLLVFPIKNSKEPRSLWSEFYPRKKMRWEWDAGGDYSVSKLWILREELSRSDKVVYTKWFRGRATFFSKELFTALLRLFHEENFHRESMGQQAQEVLDVLELDSPLSTKQLKRSTDLQGRFNEGVYNRALKALWSRFLIVGYGEVEEGAFPSLAVGATKNIFESLWHEGQELDLTLAQNLIDKKMPQGSMFRKFLTQVLA